MEKIKADFSINEKAGASKKILFLVNNQSQAELAMLSVIGSKHDYLIYLASDLYDITTDYNLPSNVTISSDAGSIIMLLPKFNGVITTVGHLSPVLGRGFKDILKFSSLLNLPLIEVPHGLYQWGFNLKDNSKIVHVASMKFGAGGYVPSIADHQINWFTPNGPGYPRFREESVRSNLAAVTPEYTVITTNTNWYMYDLNDQRVMFQLIFQHALENPNKLFIWCPHPSELANDKLFSTMFANKPKNIFLYGLNNEIYFNGVDTTEDVIKYATNGISTVSTCLLDFEIHSIPVSIFSTNGLAAILDSFIACNLFSMLKRLDASKHKPLKTNVLYRYDVKLLDENIESLIKNFCVSKLDVKTMLTQI